MPLTFKSLKTRHRRDRHGYPETISIRIHRALSWLDRAERCTTDTDARFIFLWIAFNAAYANEIDDHTTTEQHIFRTFISRLVALDQDRLLAQMVWTEFPGPIRLLLNNQYIYRPFWEHHRGNLTEQEWQHRFTRAKAAANRAIATTDTQTVLAIVFARLYVLRNQLIHGAATWNSTINRDQVRDGTNLLTKIVPFIILIMMNNPNEPWGDLCYPVIQ